MTNGPKKSDLAKVAVKPTNKAGHKTAAESVEPRARAEGNANRRSTDRTQSRTHVSGAGARTSSSEGKEERTVHCAAPPYQRRSAPTVVLRA